MSRLMRHITPLLLTLVTFVGCVRKPLSTECDCNLYALMPISVDWDPSSLTPQNVTFLVYDSSTGSLYKEFCYEHNDSDVQAYLPLPEGEYTVVVFNELRDEVNYVGCSDYENLSTLRFYSTEATPTLARASSSNYIQQPEGLGVIVIEDIIVDQDMVEYTNSSEAEVVSKVSGDTRSESERLMGITPLRKDVTMNIVVHVLGLNNALMPALVDLCNVADGYYVGSDRNTLSPATVQFTMNNRTYDSGSSTSGEISASLSLFGTLGDRLSTADHTEETPLLLDILFMLVDEEQTIVNRTIDITDMVSFNQLTATLELDLYIEMGEELPEVDSSGSDDSGFGSDLTDWDIVDVGLTL